MKWIALQPLNGGQAIGNKMAVGTDPAAIVTWPGISNDAHAMKYFPDVPVLYLDPDAEEPALIEAHRKEAEDLFRDVDFVSSVPVCAGLSLLNSCSETSCKGRGPNAEQNKNMINCMKFALGTIRPKAYMFENAPTLYTKLGEPVAAKLYQIARDHGYGFSLVKTDTAFHGIPQHRHRTFGFAWSGGSAPVLDYYRRDTPGLAKYLAEVPPDAPYRDEYIAAEKIDDDPLIRWVRSKFGSEWREHLWEKKTIMHYAYSDFGLLEEALRFLEREGEEKVAKSVARVIEKKREGKGFWDWSPVIVRPDGCVNGIIGKNMHRIVHPTEDRFLSVRELMWLMGLPHDYEFAGGFNFKSAYQISQSVPTCTARDWTLEVAKFCRGEARMTKYDFVKQSNFKQLVEVKSAPATLSDILF